MHRRRLIAILALGAAGSRLARAQAESRPRRIGYLYATQGADFPVLHDALRSGLRTFGWFDGQNVEILLRSAEGDASRYPALVADLVRQDVDVIFAANSAAAVAAKQGAPATPLVFAGVGDPIGLGLVESYARPGGRATGVGLLTPELTPKRLALLKDAVPSLARVAVLWNPTMRGQAQELASLELTASRVRLAVSRIATERAEELDAAFARMASDGTQGIVVLASPLHHREMRRIADLALARRLPGICEFSEFASVGGLMSYGPSWADMYRRAALHVSQILRGSRPGELPVEQPTRIELVVNLATARALGITLPRAVQLILDRTVG